MTNYVTIDQFNELVDKHNQLIEILKQCNLKKDVNDDIENLAYEEEIEEYEVQEEDEELSKNIGTDNDKSLDL